MTALPSPAAVRAWCQVSTSAVTDAQLQMVMDAEAVNQEKACRIPDPADRDPDLIEAFFRRVARVLAARGIPTGLTDGEQGPQRLTSWDGEIQRLEGMDRKFNFG